MRTRVVALSVATAGLLLTSFAARGEQPEGVQVFMRAKLDHAQRVLEGLALEDYAAMGRSARQLGLLSQAAAWQVFDTPEYRQQSGDFRRAADDLATAAGERNLDGAALAYVRLTLKCVRCHQYVRSARMARAAGPRLRRLAADAAVNRTAMIFVGRPEGG